MRTENYAGIDAIVGGDDGAGMFRRSRRPEIIELDEGTHTVGALWPRPRKALAFVALAY